MQEVINLRRSPLSFFLRQQGLPAWGLLRDAPGSLATFHLVDEIAVLVNRLDDIIGRALAVTETAFPARDGGILFTDRGQPLFGILDRFGIVFHRGEDIKVHGVAILGFDISVINVHLHDYFSIN